MAAGRSLALTPWRRLYGKNRDGEGRTPANAETEPGMTSAAQIGATGIGGVPGYGAPGIYGRPPAGPDQGEDERNATTLPGQDDTEQSEALPGRRPPPPPGTAPSTSDVVRLPGQETVGESGPRNPLIAGGAFTLAVAIGLSLDQRTQPQGLEPATPSTTAAADDEDQAQAEGEEDIEGLTEEERELVRELQQSDAEVRRHEAAHAAAGGEFAGAPTFTYQTGPDGKRYAVGGEVSIDTSPVRGDPEATIRKAQRIRAAANAPADPSSQDRRVAAQADSLRQQAQAELQAERREERQAEDAESAGGGTPVGQAGSQDAPGAEAAAVPGVAPPASPPPAPAEEPGFGARSAGAGGGFAPAGEDTDTAAGSRPPNGPQDRDDDSAGPFTPGAFSAAAASYRGPTARQSLVSLAV
ncbi:MAG: putative metalloprotease CJM1_0395 family protein [Thalassobaculum sp.]|uniref:putative metalloprotease CJM1_0395 family protein n=1 Tax=Thalassobaculum sp. TaxID=2022740 RepID=UPI0032EDF661